MDKAEEKSFETYPIENRIDNYPISRNGFIAGYHRAERDLIDKACKWLEENKDHPFIGCEDPCLSGYLTDKFIEEFKKAMEE